MNYRHAYHAGNFADVVKHATLALLIRRLQAKDKPFRVIDTHAGTGLYDLAGAAASKTGEWEGGIGRLLAAHLPPSLSDLLAPYLAAVTAANPDGGLRFYPGSPWIARHLLRPLDRLTAVELHPEDHAALAKHLAGDRQVKAVHLDGWLALRAFVPPKERRGLVLVDPPFEDRDEFSMMTGAIQRAWARWPTGIYALWYPLKDAAAVARFRQTLATAGLGEILIAELTVEMPAAGRFSGCGLAIVNPPWCFADDLAAVLAGLAPVLARGPGARAEVWPLTPPAASP